MIIVNESKKFANRRLAMRYIKENNMKDYKLVSVKTPSNIVFDDINSMLKNHITNLDEIINTIDMYKKDDVKCFDGSNIEDVLDRLNKVKSYMTSISCTSTTFDNSKGSVVA